MGVPAAECGTTLAFFMRDRIEQSLHDAMRARDTVRICTLRLMLAAIRDREIALRDDDGSGEALGDQDIHQLLAKMVRQREESASVYGQAGRMELAAREEAEIAIIREFMPKQLSDAEIQKAIDDAIDVTGAGSIRDMGKVMGQLKSQYAGRMDFGAAGNRVKHALS